MALSNKRIERTVYKLKNIIDKKLQENTDCVELIILPKNTDIKIKQQLLGLYPNTEFRVKNNNYVLTINTVEVNKKQIIASTLDTTEGHIALAQAMVEPIITSLMYQGMARKILLVDELPDGQMPQYEYMESDQPIYYSHRSIKEYNYERETLCDFTEIACNPTIDNSIIKERTFYIIDRIQQRAKDSMLRQEDTIVFQLLNRAATFKNTIYTYSQTLNLAIQDSLVALESQQLIGAKLITHPEGYKYLRTLDDFDEARVNDILLTGLYGHYRTLDIHVSAFVPKNTIYILPPCQFLGVMAIRQNITVLPADSPPKFGWFVYEEVFPVILNSNYVRKIVVNNIQ